MKNRPFIFEGPNQGPNRFLFMLTFVVAFALMMGISPQNAHARIQDRAGAYVGLTLDNPDEELVIGVQGQIPFLALNLGSAFGLGMGFHPGIEFYPTFDTFAVQILGDLTISASILSLIIPYAGLGLGLQYFDRVDNELEFDASFVCGTILNIGEFDPFIQIRLTDEFTDTIVLGFSLNF